MSGEPQALEPSDDFNEERADELVAKADTRCYLIAKPEHVGQIKLIRQALHKVISARLINARNKSKLNNDKINRLMLDLYMMRKRSGKGWTFTNALSPRTCYFPDAEEIDMLAEILDVPADYLGVHLRLAPWIVRDQNAAREKRKNRTPRVRTPRPGRVIRTPRTKPVVRPTATKATDSPPDQLPTVTQSQSLPVYDRPLQPKAPAMTRPQPAPAASSAIPPQYAGDLKITHSGAHLRVHAKVWCDQATAQKLRMIVPLKLLQQARNDDPWSYEINGEVHAYQLYNLMHVLYGTPRVIAVQMD